MKSDTALYGPQRIAAARAAVGQADLDALVLTPGAELRYLSGYDAKPSERLTALVVPADGPARLVVPRLERPGAQGSPASSCGVEIVDYADGDDPFALAGELLPHASPRIGASERMWALHWHGLSTALPGARLRLASEVIDPMRMVKSDAEVAELARAAEAVDRVHSRMGEWLRAGRAEAEVARDVAAAILDEGHVGVSFVIVASGPNGASPHHRPGDRIVEAGDVVVVDIGGVVSAGYGSDCTRTYSLGAPPEDFVAYYEPLRAAHRAGVEAARPGVSAESVDAAAREVLRQAGYSEYFTHRTGHGIGLDGHEAPYIVGGDKTVLREGMAFSVEPGVYLPGRHGARIEDIVVCVEGGARRLNTLSTELKVLLG
ncbi:MAG: M24 family metallopeptidase [Stackebrandtia sp.]